MSDIVSSPAPVAPVAQEPVAPEKAAQAPGFDWRAALATPEGKAVLVLLAGLVFAFLPFWIKVSEQWFEADSLYSHGPLIPLMAAYIVYERWGKLREIPVKGFAPAIVGLIPVMYLTWFASRTVMLNTLSTTFILALMLSVLFVGGWRWLLATAGPTLFLVFCMPYWSSIVDRVTQPLQALSTDMALQILNLCGLHTMRTDTTTVYLDNFHFTVAAACSGAKTTLALLAFACFFILLGRGRWYSAVALLALLIPFSLLLNGLRIALVGIIGNGVSPEAGMAFHDYGAYGLLVVGFLALGQLARLLGFKQ